MEAKTESIDEILWRMQTLHFFFRAANPALQAVAGESGKVMWH
jgi:hypothetical protein